jgi:glyoxylase-like metal-dependent hydrolase (beta-lactamase superfamily II)
MQIHNLILGDYQTNSYCLTANEEAKECLIIDTGLSPQPLVDFLLEEGLTPVAVIFTHGHADHIAGVNVLRQQWPEITVAIHKDDAVMMTDPSANLSALTGMMFQAQEPDEILEGGADVEYAGLKFAVIHTPGHTPGGICLYNAPEGVLFAGDTLFASSIGRTDFPGGDGDLLIAGIKEKLLVLPDNTQVYTGHGPATTIGDEKRSNPFLR